MSQEFSDYNKLVPLRTGLDPADAQLLKSVLTANDIEVFLNGEHMGSLGYGVRADIMVRAVDKARAGAVIDKIATMPRCQIPPHVDEDGEERACTQCGSTRVHPYVGEVPTFIPGVKVAAQSGQEWFHCLQCDSYYQDKRERYAVLPFALMWSALVGAFGYGVYWFIDWIKWL